MGFDIEDEPSPAMKQEMEAIEKEMKESGDKPENILLERIEREKIEKEAIQKTNEDLLKNKDQRIQELEKQVGDIANVSNDKADNATKAANSKEKELNKKIE